MKLIFLGAGSAFTVGTDNFHSNMLFVSDNQEKLMIDCGSDARFSLFKQNLNHLDISNVYISHLHADHAGGLEWLALTTKFDPRCTKKPNLYLCEMLINDLWNKTLSGGLSTIQCEFAQLDTFFNIHNIPVNGSFTWESCEFRLVQTVHVMNGFSLMYSFGLLFTINNMKIFITTDTQFAPRQMTDFYERADIIFHDCETSPFMSGVHAHYNEMRGMPEHLKAKMWLYHYNPGPLPSATADGFRGFVMPGQVFDFDKPETLAKP
ncbi:MBL fold metallo-hydrolase [Legionella dresdenensis]|uniref:MBL fold metallo-hydrolase n=1 Tax=Legionella dresdenensis TaxID=450200 RepID=A0ABV8CF44_9GAMM